MPVLPPEVPGLPLIGSAPQFARDPRAFVLQHYQKLGPIFSFRMGPQPVAVLVGSQYNDYFFRETDRSLSMREAYRFLAPAFGEVLFVGGVDTYKAHRPIVMPAFSAKLMPGYLKLIREEAELLLQEFGQNGSFDIVPLTSTLTMNVAVRAFLGDDFRRFTGNEFRRLYQDLAKSVSFVLPPNLPIPKFIKRDRARKKLVQLITQVVVQRRTMANPPQDALQRFSEAKAEDGNFADADLIAHLIMSNIHAGYDSTTSLMSWTLVHLLQNPSYLNRVVSEIDALDHGHDNPHQYFERLPMMERALKETERLEPAVVVVPRYNKEGYDMDGYHIPKGWFTMVAPGVTSRLPEFHPDPERYDPDRFSPERQEDKKNPLASFGGGQHRCPGRSFALCEVRVMLGLLLQRYHLQLVGPTPKVDSKQFSRRPESPCIVRYERRIRPVVVPSAVLQSEASVCPFATARQAALSADHHP